MQASRLWSLLLFFGAASAQAQGIYPGDAVRVNAETISYQRFQGFYIEYRNSKGVQSVPAVISWNC